jgi:hypothetical protein
MIGSTCQSRPFRGSIQSSIRMAARDLPSDELRTQLIGARKAIADLIDKTNANPLMVLRSVH